MTLPITLRAAFLVYLALINLLLAVVAYTALRDQPLTLLMVEVGFVLSLYLGYRLVRALAAPLELVRTGSEMIEGGGVNRPSYSGLDDAGRYNPTTYTWHPVSTVDAPKLA